MMRKDGSDTDSDMPSLVDPGGDSPGGNRSDLEDVELSLGELRDVETHLVLADQDNGPPHRIRRKTGGRKNAG